MGGRAHGEECVAAAGAAEAFPAAHYLEFQGPREIRPRERLKATARAKAPGRTRARQRGWVGGASGPGAPHRGSRGRAGESGPPRSGTRRLSCVLCVAPSRRLLPAEHTPSSQASGSRARPGAREAGQSVTHLRSGVRSQEAQLRPGRPRRPPPIGFLTAVRAPAGRPWPSCRHFRHSNRPPMAGPNRGNPAAPASPGGSRDGRAGTARAPAHGHAHGHALTLRRAPSFLIPRP